jgi:colanic acid/amylovoran biosynthesis protein
MGNNKIKVVGQPMYNIGDLAACKSLTLLLKNKYDSPLEYSIFENRTIDDEFKKIDGAKFEKNITVSNKYIKIFTILSPKSIRIISFFFPKIKKKYKSLLDSDLVLFAPGGLELGLYKEWDYLWIMSVLVAFKKDFGLYSRSIGDFQNKTILDLIFKKQAIKYLKLSKFNGLRDQRSQKEAKSLGIPFFPSIEVVFSSVPDYNKFHQGELTAKFGSNYMVFTPSTFEWHPKFSAYPSQTFIDLYLKIMNTIIEKSDLNIVMLPHIYKDNSDTRYFNSLKAKCIDHDRVFVLEDNPDSDLYQFIISKAKCALLSRLHQTIFSINNHTPFICISYEHKMEDMMKILGLEDYSVNLQDVLEQKVEISTIIHSILFNQIEMNRLIESQKKANQIALNSFEKLTQIISDIK